MTHSDYLRGDDNHLDETAEQTIARLVDENSRLTGVVLGMQPDSARLKQRIAELKQQRDELPDCRLCQELTYCAAHKQPYRDVRCIDFSHFVPSDRIVLCEITHLIDNLPEVKA